MKEAASGDQGGFQDAGVATPCEVTLGYACRKGNTSKPK